MHRCVTPGRRYSAALVLRNAGASAMKVQIHLGPPTSRLRELLLSYLSFAPDFGYVQAGGSLPISVGLAPQSDMAAKLARFLVEPADDEAASILQIPVTVSVPGQPLPVAVTLRAQLTTSDLHITPSTLDLGRVPLGEAAAVQLAIHNPGKLPQSFSFGGGYERHTSVTIDGYGTVLPGETAQVLVSYRPPIPGPQFFSLRCTTLAGRVFVVEGKCEGHEPLVVLSHNIIKVRGRWCAALCFDDARAVVGVGLQAQHAGQWNQLSRHPPSKPHSFRPQQWMTPAAFRW